MPDAQSCLSALPAGLRNHILTLVLTPGDPDTSYALCGKFCSGQPPLALVNRQLRSETLPIYYAENIFQLHATRPGQRGEALGWLCVNKNHLSHLRRVSAVGWSYGVHRATVLRIQLDLRMWPKGKIVKVHTYGQSNKTRLHTDMQKEKMEPLMRQLLRGKNKGILNGEEWKAVFEMMYDILRG
ncbi:hypothetical protein LTR85_002391 [Meristemomyces frigidus]|nr:hypothetical protein LTR85_002391 [Meristemomyces frigidus]